jgi:hypothetical protein
MVSEAMVAHGFKSSMQETETGRLSAQGQFELHSETLSCNKTNKNDQWTQSIQINRWSKKVNSRPGWEIQQLGWKFISETVILKKKKKTQKSYKWKAQCMLIHKYNKNLKTQRKVSPIG